MNEFFLSRVSVFIARGLYSFLKEEVGNMEADNFSP